jgi:AraC family transcriptional regulator
VDLPVPAALPSRLLASSAGLGWRSVHAASFRDPATTDAFALARSPHLRIVLVTSGRYEIESRTGRSWRRALYHPGSLGVTAPHQPSVLRWRASATHPMESVHLHLDRALVGETLAAFGAEPQSLPDTLTLDDDYVSAASGRIAHALRTRAPALYADTLAHGLVTHLVHRSLRTRPPEPPPFDLGRVVDHMRAHLDEDLDLDRLAAVAALSKFHFVRAFARATGRTPHRYLVDLRLGRAAEMLRGTRLPVRQIALQCGYRSPSQFAAAFRRAYGVAPSEY